MEKKMYQVESVRYERSMRRNSLGIDESWEIGRFETLEQARKAFEYATYDLDRDYQCSEITSERDIADRSTSNHYGVCLNEITIEVDEDGDEEFIDSWGIDEYSVFDYQDKLKKKVEEELNEQNLKEELIEKAKYFNMNPICEKAGVSYNSYRSWKSKGTPLSKDKIEKLLKVMKEVAE